MTEPRKASMTAAGVAAMRVVHQLFDAEPRVLDDPIVPLLFGDDGLSAIRDHLERFQDPGALGLRAHVLLRSRYAEDCLREAVARGIRQYILLGAGLDTFAYRQPEWAGALKIVEVDHPSSQAAKRARLAKAAIEIPANVRFADVDFENETLAEGLRRCGVRLDVPTFFSWLGVTMYLTRDAIDTTLRTVAAFPKGSEIVLTFAQPAADDGRSLLAERAAEAGEPWLSYFTPAEIEAALRACGFSNVEFLTREDAARHYFSGRTDALDVPRRVSIVAATV